MRKVTFAAKFTPEDLDRIDALADSLNKRRPPGASEYTRAAALRAAVHIAAKHVDATPENDSTSGEKKSFRKSRKRA